jgi:putative sigma-54 modulation protein
MDRLDRQVMKYKQILKNHSHTSMKRTPEGGDTDTDFEAAAA